MSNCRYCGHPAGWLRRQHRDCRSVYQDGRHRMITLVEQAAGQSNFSEAKLRNDLSAIAQSAYIPDDSIPAIIAAGWRRAIKASLADGILTQDEEARLRAFRDQFARQLEQTDDSKDAAAQLRRGVRKRLLEQARQAALDTADPSTSRQTLAAALAASELKPAQRRTLLAQAWKAAVESSLQDRLLSRDEEHALIGYLSEFDLSQHAGEVQLAHQDLLKAAVIRDAAEGLIPDRLNLDARPPFNLMKSEQLVWLIDAVGYHETKTRRERRGSSQGVSVRVAKGLYYSPRTFRSRTVEWEETVREDTGILGVTSKHLYFHGARKRFRIRYDRIVSFDAYEDGIGVNRDAQTAKPQTFITGDGWFIYNLVTNLAQR